MQIETGWAFGVGVIGQGDKHRAGVVSVNHGSRTTEPLSCSVEALEQVSWLPVVRTPPTDVPKLHLLAATGDRTPVHTALVPQQSPLHSSLPTQQHASSSCAAVAGPGRHKDSSGQWQDTHLQRDNSDIMRRRPAVGIVHSTGKRNDSQCTAQSAGRCGAIPAAHAAQATGLVRSSAIGSSAVPGTCLAGVNMPVAEAARPSPAGAPGGSQQFDAGLGCDSRQPGAAVVAAVGFSSVPCSGLSAAQPGVGGLLATNCSSEDAAPLPVNYIPVFGCTAALLEQQQQLPGPLPPLPQHQANASQPQHDAAAAAAADHMVALLQARLAACLSQAQVSTAVGGAAAPVDAAVEGSAMHGDMRDAEQLAQEVSSSDWQPRQVDRLVAVMQAPAGWLCGPDSRSFEAWGYSSSLSKVPEERLPTQAHQPCVTVSTVSSELDSLAILKLETPPVMQLEGSVGVRCSELMGSRHLGQF